MHRESWTRRVLAGLGGVVLGAAVVAGCSSTDEGSGRSADSAGGSDAAPHIVASTNVYGSIARAVAGDAATVESLISDPGADPHSYEASPADAAAVTDADLVIYNGAGYDSFIDQALDNATNVPAIEAVEVFTETTGTTVAAHDHGDEHDDGEEHDHGADEHTDGDAQGSTSNEHVWYSLPTIAALATEIADRLGEIDPGNASIYSGNAATFSGEMTALNDSFLAAAKQADDVEFIQTEPIGGHLFSAAGFHDRTPPGFTSAIEEGVDPAAGDFAQMRDLAGNTAEITFVAFNSQTVTPTTEQIRSAAETAGVPVVALTETLPEGTDYATWMRTNVDAITAAMQ